MNQKVAPSSLPFHSSRTAIERLKKRPLRGLNAIDLNAITKIAKLKTVSRKVKKKYAVKLPPIASFRNPSNR